MSNEVPGRFAGKVALITGAGSGIGRATATRLAAEGARVFGHDVNGEGLAATAETITGAGGTVQTRAGDVTERAECVATVAAAVEAFGQLDVLGNVAGIAQSVHFTEMTEADYRRMVGVNQRRAVLLLPGRHPPPARHRRQHRQHRLQRGADGPGLHRRLLHDEGRRHPAHQGPRHGVREDAVAGERHRSRRRRTPPSRPTSRCPTTSTSPDGALHGLPGHGPGRRDRRPLQLRGERRGPAASTARCCRADNGLTGG